MPERTNVWTSSVVRKILEKGRKAMLGGTPILYIKTDSDILINRIVSEPDYPLVVLRGSAKINIGRPLMEGRRTEVVHDYDTMDYIEGLSSLPGSDSVVLDYPRLWVQKMPCHSEQNQYEIEERRKIHQKLSAYVRAYLDADRYGDSRYGEALCNSVVLLYSHDVYLSSGLKTYTEIIDVEYPDETDIRNQILAETGNPPELTEETLNMMVTNLTGLSEEEITICLQRVIANTGFEDSNEIAEIIIANKKQRMEGGLLEWCSSACEIGGMGNYCDWIDQLIGPIKNSAEYKRKTGTPPPKGVLLCGIPGCGKSEAAKFTAQKLELPLLKMDMGSIMNKYVGASESRMRETLALAEAMSPCVLWIDELEKAMSGTQSSEDSSFQRMFAYLLTWMQENTKPVFIFATANDIGGLPDEFFRSGRFDALFAVYLPTEDECVEIFQKSMERAEKNAAEALRVSVDEINIFENACKEDDLLRGIIHGMCKEKGPRIMVGADIQKIVNTALRSLPLGKMITHGVWESALKKACAESDVYGDSEEKLQSIALSYCRLLRKGFQPTSRKVLFDKQDYHVSNYNKKKKLMEELKHGEEKDMQILQKKEISGLSRYDQAVYDCLYERINEVAWKYEEVALRKRIEK